MTIKSNDKRDIVLFLGAGFSAGAKLPTMKQFGDESHSQLEGIKKKHLDPKSSDYRECAPIFTKAGDIFEMFQDFLRSSWKEEDVNNMEKVFCAAEIFKECKKDIILESNSFHPEHIINQMAMWLWKIYHQCPPINQEKSNGIQINDYDKFIELLKEHSNRLTVITTNYDLIFEYLSFTNQLICRYPIEADEIRITECGKDYVSFGSKDKEDPSDVILCKLHGSINFFINKGNPDGLNGDMDRLFISKDLGEGQNIEKTPNWEKDKPAIFAFDALCKIQKKLGEDFFPAIIPPTYSKLYGYEWLRNMWNRALNALIEAKKIIFIGYSLPESDGFMSSMIMCANALRDKNKPLNILVVNKENLEERYKAIFKDNNILSIVNCFPGSDKEIGDFINSVS